MNHALHLLAAELDLASDAHEALRLRFALDCVERVKHFIEREEVLDGLAGLRRIVDGHADRSTLEAMARDIAQLANQHRGSPSLDGCGHAAVSASYAVANALAGRALAAADYAAYARVYGDGGYGAVADTESFQPERAWQVAHLMELAGR